IVGIEGAAIGLPCAAPWYVDPDARLAGPLDFGLPPGLVSAFLAAPPIDPPQAMALGGVFERDFRPFDLPRPQTGLVEEIRDAALQPVLRLVGRRHGWSPWLPSHAADESVDIALLGFAYDGRVIDLAGAPEEMRRVEGDRLVIRRRDIAAEQEAFHRLRRLGLGPAGDFNKRGSD